MGPGVAGRGCASGAAAPRQPPGCACRSLGSKLNDNVNSSNAARPFQLLIADQAVILRPQLVMHIEDYVLTVLSGQFLSLSRVVRSILVCSPTCILL